MDSSFFQDISTKWNTVSYRIWIRVADSIPYYDNRYTECVSLVI